MDLKSGYPFWSVKNGLMQSFPPLREDHQCDVAIVGAGITGALIAHELSAHGRSVCVLDSRDAGWGSTSASTAMLQYEIDTHMLQLRDWYGEADAALAYTECVRAIDLIARLARKAGNVDFAKLRSLYFASRKGHVKDMRREFLLRAEHGIDVSWLDSSEVARRFGIDAPAAILSSAAARVDPYRLAMRLLTALDRGAGAVFDRTCITRIEVLDRGVKLTASNDCVVRAQQVVIAGGYESQQWIDQNVATNRSSYACISDPIEPESLRPFDRTMAWESARPYLYFRATGDGRLLAGGEDDALDIPARRDAQVGRKSDRIARRVNALLPALDFKPVFAWAGTFAETDDGLPFFGPHEQHGPRVQFAMAYGGNGITYSALGAELIRANLDRKTHPLRDLFSFARLGRRGLLARLGF